MKKEVYLWVLLRLSLGLIFLWAFLDKLFGLGFTTCRNAETGVTQIMCQNAWLSGGSPTTGFLKFATHGPFATLYQSLVGSVAVDWLFMLGLLLIGLALILGIGMKLAAYSGALLLFMMWTATLPPEHHPFIDEHIIYALVLILLYYVKAGHYFGYGEQWSKSYLVKNHPILE